MPNQKIRPRSKRLKFHADFKPNAKKTLLMLFYLFWWSVCVHAAGNGTLQIDQIGSDVYRRNNFDEFYNSCKIEGRYDLKALQNLLPKLSSLSESHIDDLPKIVERNTLRVLTTYSMTNYFVLEGQSFGFEYSLMKEYQRFLNRGKTNRNLGIVVEFLPVSENVLTPGLINGLGDIVAAGLTVSAELIPEVEFTDPYFSGIRATFVYNKNVSDIKQISDFAGKQIFVRPIESFYECLGNLDEILIARDLQPVRIVKANEFLTTGDILELVNAGIVEISLAENHLAERWAKIMPNLKIYNQITLCKDSGLGWMVRKNNPELRSSLNEFIKTHKKGTYYGNLYFKRYFKNTQWIKNPLNQDDIVKFSRYAPLFKKYGSMYNIDWMLLAALSYQESGLNHNRRSRAGAIGLMQVLPSTALDSRIRIENIDLLENNIHAGTKYLAMLRDNYYAKKDLISEDRIRFALAAYNAGPNKIRRCRTVASMRGYDPNRWFRHTEMAALELIGLETPRYVSNITKYYLAYRLSNTLDCLKSKQLGKLNQIFQEGM